MISWVGLQIPSNGDRIDENTVVPSRYSQMLYAHWRVKQINVSFDANGGSVSDDKVVTYQSIYGNLPTSVRYGYDFLGWFDKDKVEADRYSYSNNRSGIGCKMET